MAFKVSFSIFRAIRVFWGGINVKGATVMGKIMPWA